MTDATGSKRASRYAPWLWVLTGLFCARVAAQLVLLFVDVPSLPPFDDWHGGVLPYGWLLGGQLMVIAVLVGTALAFSSGRVLPAPRLGLVLLLLGTVYLGAMGVRLALGLTILDDHPWFTVRIPIVFHLVLATFVLLVGSFHAARIKECFP